MSKRSFISYVLYILLSLVPFAAGLYALFEKKTILAGRLAPGGIYELEFPANIIVAASYFLFSAFILFALTELKHKKRICELSFILGLILLFIGIMI